MSSLRSRSGGNSMEKVEPVKKIAPNEQRRSRSEIAMVAEITRTSQRNISVPPTRSNSRYLQNAQQRDLCFQGEIAHFVEEKCPPSANSNGRVAADRSRKRSFLVTNNFGHDQGGRNRGQFTLTNDRSARFERWWNCTRD